MRVVCNNTLTIALEGTSRAIKVPHNTRFDPQAVKKQLGIAVSQWDDFMYRMRALAERKVQWHEALGFFMNVMCETSPTGALPEHLPNERALRKVQELYEGRGRGSQLDSACGTAWGLLNAVTEYVDHERRARSNEYPREVVKVALEHNAAAIVLVHNHPSGDPEPSHADRVLTSRLKQALEMVGVRTLDHIIVGAEGCVSLAEQGYL